MTKLSVAIVGAGMGGLATAAALHRAGIGVDVYEQASKFARLGAGIQIGCNAMKVLRGLGLEPVMRASAFYPRSWNNREYDTGEVRFDMVFGRIGGAAVWRAVSARPPRRPAFRARQRGYRTKPFISTTASWGSIKVRTAASS